MLPEYRPEDLLIADPNLVYDYKELNNEIIALQQKIISLGNDNLKLKEELTTLKSEVCSNKTVKMDDNGFIRKEKDKADCKI